MNSAHCFNPSPSWVVRHRKTKKAVFETSDMTVVEIFESPKTKDKRFSFSGVEQGVVGDYEAVTILEYLEGLNRTEVQHEPS